MDTFEDYYAVLGVSHEVNADDIKSAYIDKCFILHPDRLMGAPESARRTAEEELKKVNRAYEILKDQRKRVDYDKQWMSQNSSPKPIIKPTNIQLKDMIPGEERSVSFTISNAGGPYSNIWIDNPDTWVRVVEWNSISPTDELPLKVTIQVEAPYKGKVFSEVIRVKLDDEETCLTLNLQTKVEQSKSKKKGGGIFDKFKKPGLVPSFTLIDHRWHEMQYEYLPDWIKNRRHKLDSGEELVGKTFRYKRNKYTGKYQIRLRYRRKTGFFK